MNAGNSQARESTVKSIQDAVAHMFGLAVEALKTESSTRVVSMPRQIAMFLNKELTDASLAQIGEYFGDRHDRTVMYSIARGLSYLSRKLPLTLSNVKSNR